MLVPPASHQQQRPHRREAGQQQTAISDSKHQPAPSPLNLRRAGCLPKGSASKRLHARLRCRVHRRRLFSRVPCAAALKTATIAVNSGEYQRLASLGAWVSFTSDDPDMLSHRMQNRASNVSGRLLQRHCILKYLKCSCAKVLNYILIHHLGHGLKSHDCWA